MRTAMKLVCTLFALLLAKHSVFSEQNWRCAASEKGTCTSLTDLLPPLSALRAQATIQSQNGSEASGAHIVDLVRSRRVVWMTAETGLSNSWQGAVCAFYIAVLTDSLFFMDMGSSASWEMGYVPHAIDWRITPDLRKALAASPATTIHADWGKRGQDLEQRLERDPQDLITLFGGKQVLRFQGNRVHWDALFRNPVHKAALKRRLRVNEATAFGCAFGFLVRLRREGCGAFEARVVETLSDPSTVSVGLQVRLGVGGARDDRAFRDPELAVAAAAFAPFVEAALATGQRMLKAQSPQRNRLVIFFISDSMPLRRAFEAEFSPPSGRWSSSGAVLLTNTESIELRHIRIGSSSEGFLDAAWESWLFGMCDSFVLTSSSSFGWVANLARSAPGWAPHRKHQRPVQIVPLPQLKRAARKNRRREPAAGGIPKADTHNASIIPAGAHNHTAAPSAGT